MNQLRRSTHKGYEDLMRELEVIEHKILKENSSLAMDLMVVEAKIRERFQNLEGQIYFGGIQNEGPAMSLDALQSLIPQELPSFPSTEQLQGLRPHNRMRETVVLAALLAVFVGLGVFGLASVLQIGLSWLA